MKQRLLIMEPSEVITEGLKAILDGQIRFHQHLAPYTPAEDILNTLEFDPDALATALNGG